MTSQRTFTAVADDTALVANISEIKKWVAQGRLTLVIPVYTLDRLHLLKRDTSQIGINAKEAVKFLDRVTSGRDNAPEDAVQLQGPTESFQTWDEVEAQLSGQIGENGNVKGRIQPLEGRNADGQEGTSGNGTTEPAANTPRSTNVLSQMLLDRLNFAKEPETHSNDSTPPTSPASSHLHSSKPSPEVTAARPANSTRDGPASNPDAVVVPHTHRPLINSAVYLLRKQLGPSTVLKENFLLTNDGETANIARNFGLEVRNIHQLRSGISSENVEAKNQSRYQRKHSPKPSLVPSETKPKTLFSYEDGGDDDEEDEVVYRPRTGRGGATSHGRATRKMENRRSAEVQAPSIEIPTQEIDPDSFDRGAFSRVRPVTPTGPAVSNGHQARSVGRGSARGIHGPHSTRGNAGRGSLRGFDRGTPSRGKGKLFVP